MNRSPSAGMQRQPHVVLLALGLTTGVVCAAAGLTSSTAHPGLPASAVARVNGELILRDDFRRVLGAVAADKRDPVGEEQRRQLLDRLIEEELLVQRALELGVTHSDRRVRKDLTSAVMDSVLSEVGDVNPSDDVLRRFYDEQRDFFAAPGRVQLHQIMCRIPAGGDGAAAADKAREAVQRLRAGEDFGAVQSALGDAELAPLPAVPLPPAKLVEYLGPAVARAALSLEAGQVSDPVRSSTGLHVLQVMAKQPGVVPAFEEIREQVLAEYRRHAGEQALRAYLDNLRARASIEYSPKLP